MLNPQYADQQTLVRLPKINFRSQSFSSVNKTSTELQDQLTAKSWLIVTPTYQLGFRATNKRQIASITKTMTCLCSIEICRKYNINIKAAFFKVTNWSVSISGTSANLQSNSWISIQDLLYGLMLPSGNDAALVLAENLGAVLYFDKTGNKDLIRQVRSIDLTEDHDSVKLYLSQFINYMNDKAKLFHMKRTSFANPHGLDHVNNYSCCEDILSMCKQATNSELFSKIVSTIKYKGTFKILKDKKIISKTILWTNTNKLLQRNPFVIGIKTGITPKAGGCLATQFQIDQENQGFIIVLGCNSAEARFKDTQTILNFISNQKTNF